MTITTVINTNVQSIDRVLATDMPVLLAFWRPTTPMTPAQEESLERLAQSYAGRAILARVDADAEPELARRFRVAGTPVYVVLRNGKAKLALASEEARNNVAGWLAHFVDGKPQPAVTEPSPGSAGSGGQVLTLTDATFQQTIDQPVPVLVDARMGEEYAVIPETAAGEALLVSGSAVVVEGAERLLAGQRVRVVATDQLVAEAGGS